MKNWTKRYADMKRYFGWKNQDVADLTGNTADSIKNITSSDNFPRWGKLAIIIFEKMKKINNMKTLPKEQKLLLAEHITDYPINGTSAIEEALKMLDVDPALASEVFEAMGSEYEDYLLDKIDDNGNIIDHELIADEFIDEVEKVLRLKNP